VALLAPNQVPAIQFDLSFKPIWDGTLKKEWEQNSKKNWDKEHSHSNWAIHVKSIAKIALTSKPFLKNFAII